MWDKDMSDEMKVIMESWRSWGLTQKMFGDKFKLDPRKPIPIPEGERDLALFIKPAGVSKYHKIILWRPTKVNRKKLIVRGEVVGMMYMSKTTEPCIPDTYQVNFSAVDPDLKGKGFGSLLYGIGFHYANNVLGGGLTSDHDQNTNEKAQKMWDRYADTKGMVKQQTSAGNDEFDYNDKTDDPDDDCGIGGSLKTFKSTALGSKYRRGLAAHNSWVMKDNKFSPLFDKLSKTHKEYKKQSKNIEVLEDSLLEKSSDLFKTAYGN